MTKRPWKTSTVKIVDLFLDESNIRVDLGDGVLSQDTLIHDLFINQDSFNLSQRIARLGLFQHELPIVTKEKGRFVVLEGNRRIAALKALYQPNLVPSKATKLEQLKKESAALPITEIEVKIAPNREAALPILAALHTAESRKPWAPLRQAYFYYAQIKSKSRTLKQLIDEYPDYEIPKFVRMWEMHIIARSLKYDSLDEAEQVGNQQNFPISTLERIYNSDSFQTAFGVSFQPTGEVKVSSDRKSFETCFKRIIQDVVNREVTSRTLNTKENVVNYIDSIKKPEPAQTKQSLHSRSFKPVTPPKRKPRISGLAPKDITCKIPYPAVKRQLIELQKLSFRTYPNATHDLLRSFLENSLKAYFDHKNLKIPHRNKKFTFLSDVLKFAEHHFSTEKISLVQPIQIIRGSSLKEKGNYIYSQDFLNALNHNPEVFSTGDHVKDAWEQMESLIRYVLDPK